MSLHDKAAALRALHHRDTPVVFVNAWDGVSARIVESVGFPAVATGSAGVAYAAGLPDGQRLSREQMLGYVKSMAAAINVPLTADLEGGYGPTVEDAIATVSGALDAGAVGMNFEDSVAGGTLLPAGVQAERIRAMRRIADERGVPFVINARTDVYHADGDDAALFTEAVARAKTYLAAGADCIFVPFIADAELIGRLCAAIPGPVNILAGGASPDVATLTKLGVKRISLGSGPISHLLAIFRREVTEIRDHGTYAFMQDRISHADLQTLLSR